MVGSEMVHESPDSLLRLVVRRVDGDVLLGFAGYDWHTHADMLAAIYGTTNEAAVERFVDDVTGNRAIIAVLKRSGTVVDVWITDDPHGELRYRREHESLEFRLWNGSPAGRQAGILASYTKPR
jgi:hypothetical protein